MSPKYSLLLTFIFFIVQCCLSNVIPSNEGTESVEESSELEKKIEAFYGEETTKFTVEYLTLGRDIAKKLLSKLETAEHFDETLEAEMEKLSDYIRKVDYLLVADAERVKAAKEEEVDAVYDEILNIASESPNSSWGDSLKLFLLSVKHVQDFSDDVNDLWNSLSAEEKSEGEEFGAWLQQLKEESLENKFRMLEMAESDTDEEQSPSNSSDVESRLKDDIEIFQAKEVYKFSEVLLDILKDVLSYVHQDWWVVRDTNVKAESRAQQIAQISLLLDDLTQLKPSSITDKVNFLLKWLDFLNEESFKELLVRTLRHRNLDPYEFAQKKFSPFFNELGEELSKYYDSLNPQQQSKLTNYTSWLQKFKEETDVIKKAELFSTLEDVF